MTLAGDSTAKTEEERDSMKMFRYSWLAVIALLLVLVSACGGEAPTATTAPAAATDTPAAAAAATATPAAAAAATDTPAAAAAATDTPAAAAAATDTPAAAAPAATNTPAPTETPAVLGSSSAKTTITIWHNWEGEYYKPIAGIFNDYVTAHPDVSINLLHVPDLENKVKNAVPAGAGPDIIAWVDDHIGEDALIGVIDPLDDLKGAGIDKAYLQANYPQVAQDAVTYDGKIYGLPESMEAVTMIYNKKLITEDKLPKNTTELMEMAKAYNQANPGQYFAVWNPKDAYFNAWLFYGAGAFYVDENGNVGLNTPEGIAAGKYIQDAQAILPKDVDYGVADSLFKDGKAPIILNGPWYIADLQKAGIDFGLAKLPAIDFGKKGPAKQFVGVKVVMLAHGSKNPDIAADVMKYYTSKDAQMKLAEGVVPAQNDAAAARANDPIVAGFNAQAKDGVPLPNTPFMTQLWDPVAKGLTTLFTTNKDPKDVMAEVQKTAEDNIAKMK